MLDKVKDTAMWVETLSDMPPGPRLSARLARIDPTRLHGTELVRLVTARYRQTCYESAQFLRATRELAYSDPNVTAGEPVRAEQRDPHSRHEVAFALTVTEYTAQRLVNLSVFAVDTTPGLLTAMQEGRLDLAKAKLFHAELATTTDVHARAIVAALDDEMDRCTIGQLRGRIRTLLLNIDPDNVRKMREKGERDRTVEYTENPDGTVTISGINLPKAKAAAAIDNVDRIASATKASGGDDRTIPQLRNDVLGDLLAGVDPTLAGAATPAPRKGVINLTVDLTTLLCLDEHSGDIAGFGPVTADIARQAACQMAATAQWRFTVTDANGDAVAAGTLKNRPDLSRFLESDGKGGYRPTAAIRNFVNLRDRTCRAPGCTRPAMRCEQDHIRDWAYSHETTVTNLCCLCKAHHRAKHVGGYGIERTHFGIEWVTPRGARYTVLPENADAPDPVTYLIHQYVHGQPIKLRR